MRASPWYRMSRCAGVVLRAVVCGLILAGASAPASSSQATLLTPTAETAKGDDAKVELKMITGTVSGVGAGFIAVEFQRDEKKGASLEMALPVDEKALVSQKDTLKMLHLGDTVAVEYQERTAKDDRGEYTKVKRAATRITLVKRAVDAATTGAEGSRAE